MAGEFVAAEIVRLHAGRDQEEIERKGAGDAFGARDSQHSASQIHAGDLAQQDIEICLADRELTKRRGNLGGRQHSRRHLVQQRLKDMVIAPIDEQYVRLASPQRMRCGDAGKATDDDRDPLSTGLTSLAGGRRESCSQRARSNVLQDIGHAGTASELAGCEGGLVRGRCPLDLAARLEQRQQNLVALGLQLAIEREPTSSCSPGMSLPRTVGVSSGPSSTFHQAVKGPVN